MTTALDYWAWRFAKADSDDGDDTPARDGGAELRRYWVHGEGAIKIDWHAPGALARCELALGDKVTFAPALCRSYYKDATGKPYSADREDTSDGPRDRRRGRRSDTAKAELPDIRHGRFRDGGGSHNGPDSRRALGREVVEMKHKGIDVGKIKAGADDGLGEGEFIAYASVFGNVDSAGDVVQRGAFAKTIEAWAKSGNTLPILYGHDAKNPHMNVGGVVSMVEDDRGLKVHGKLDLETDTGAQVYRLIKGRRLSQLSFAYDEIRTRPVKGDPRLGSYKSLDELHVHEVSLVPVGANRETAVLAVKSEPAGPSVKAWEAYFTAAKFGPALAPA